MTHEAIPDIDPNRAAFQRMFHRICDNIDALTNDYKDYVSTSTDKQSGFRELSCKLSMAAQYGAEDVHVVVVHDAQDYPVQYRMEFFDASGDKVENKYTFDVKSESVVFTALHMGQTEGLDNGFKQLVNQDLDYNDEKDRSKMVELIMYSACLPKGYKFPEQQKTLPGVLNFFRKKEEK